MKLHKEFFYFLLMFIVLSCHEEDAIKRDGDIEKAKTWFLQNEANLSSLLKQDASGRDRTIKFEKRPDWKKSKVHETSNGNKAIEVVLDYNTYLMPSDKTPQSGRPNMLSSMLLFETKQGDYKIYLLKTYPENPDTKLDKGDFNRLNYGKIPGDFSGKMMVFDWNENFLGGWQISNGEKTQYIIRAENEDTQDKSVSDGRTAGGCYTVVMEWYIQVCTEDGSYCTDWSLYETDSNIHCDYTSPQAPQPPDGGGNSGGGGGTGGAGGSGGSGSGDCVTPDEYIQDLMVPCEDAIPVGDKPIYEYPNKCQGLQNIWNNFPSNEMYGYITSEGSLIVTNQLPFSGGAAFGTFTHSNGTTYYPYPMNQGAPSFNYAGMIQYPPNNPTHYLIPVVASVHTHSPCRTDGTNGVSHSVGNDDKTFAASHPGLTHWVIGCNAVAQYNSSSNSFINVQTGNISSTCNSIK